MLPFKDYFLTTLNEATYFHGTIENFVDEIEKAGKLLSNNKGSRKISGGINSEKDFVYLTPSFNVAAQFARGIEARMVIGNTLKNKFGAVIKVELPDDIKLIDVEKPLNNEELEIVNRFLPHYKPLHYGDPLRKFWFRTNRPEDFTQLIKQLGYSGYIQDKHQIAILDEVQVNAIYRSEDEYVGGIQI